MGGYSSQWLLRDSAGFRRSALVNKQAFHNPSYLAQSCPGDSEALSAFLSWNANEAVGQWLQGCTTPSAVHSGFTFGIPPSSLLSVWCWREAPECRACQASAPPCCCCVPRPRSLLAQPGRLLTALAWPELAPAGQTDFDQVDKLFSRNHLVNLGILAVGLWLCLALEVDEAEPRGSTHAS